MAAVVIVAEKCARSELRDLRYLPNVGAPLVYDRAKTHSQV